MTVANESNLVLVQQLSADRSELRKMNPVSSGHTAVVYLDKRGSYVLGAGRLTMGEIWWNAPKEVYTVDIAPHGEAFTLELPSREEAFFFSGKIRATWRVDNPVAAVRDKITDPTAAIRRLVEENLRELTREFDVESSASAERKINFEFRDRAMRLSTAVVVNGCSVTLALDEGTRTHIATRTLAVRERETIVQDRETEATAHLLERQRAANRQELEQLEAAHALELKRQSMEFYADALRTGSHNVLALRLAGHHDDVNDVIGLLMKQQNLEFEGARMVLNSLLEANLLNRKDVAGIMANASNRMVDHLSGKDQLSLERTPRDPEIEPMRPRLDLDSGPDEDEEE